MPKLTLDPEELTVETFPLSSLEENAKPRTHEPGCTLPELCGTG